MSIDFSDPVQQEIWATFTPSTMLGQKAARTFTEIQPWWLTTSTYMNGQIIAMGGRDMFFFVKEKGR